MFILLNENIWANKVKLYRLFNIYSKLIKFDLIFLLIWIQLSHQKRWNQYQSKFKSKAWLNKPFGRNLNGFKISLIFYSIFFSQTNLIYQIEKLNKPSFMWIIETITNFINNFYSSYSLITLRYTTRKI